MWMLGSRRYFPAARRGRRERPDNVNVRTRLSSVPEKVKRTRAPQPSRVTEATFEPVTVREVEGFTPKPGVKSDSSSPACRSKSVSNAKSRLPDPVSDAGGRSATLAEMIRWTLSMLSISRDTQASPSRTIVTLKPAVSEIGSVGRASPKDSGIVMVISASAAMPMERTALSASVPASQDAVPMLSGMASDEPPVKPGRPSRISSAATSASDTSKTRTRPLEAPNSCFSRCTAAFVTPAPPTSVSGVVGTRHRPLPDVVSRVKPCDTLETPLGPTANPSSLTQRRFVSATAGSSTCSVKRSSTELQLGEMPVLFTETIEVDIPPSPTTSSSAASSVQLSWKRRTIAAGAEKLVAPSPNESSAACTLGTSTGRAIGSVGQLVCRAWIEAGFSSLEIPLGEKTNLQATGKVHDIAELAGSAAVLRRMSFPSRGMPSNWGCEDASSRKLLVMPSGIARRNSSPILTSQEKLKLRSRDKIRPLGSTAAVADTKLKAPTRDTSRSCKPWTAPTDADVRDRIGE
eukprot:scaffold2853_cov246-Pinguiococcus_pyrenoidosus.AAC.2